ncbi:MAG: hypothetical protein OCU18_00365 [Candidatus Syntrophoarchaeum sp.]|nr:hypothetical protein [Candidatus Syntrophoarchaeum sp.]
MDVAEKEDTTNRLIIGIGGQGSKIVNNILSILKSDRIPRNEEFLIIDTDQASANACTEIEERRKIVLSRPDTVVMKNVNRWLPDPYLMAAGAGCGQHRIYGRAMYNVHRERIMNAIGSATSDLRNRTGGKDFLILMVSALGGGTGSSMLLDIAIDIRDWITKQFGSGPLIFGITILPSSNESGLPMGNGYATLKELHFLMSHQQDMIIEDKNYSNPFKIVFLLGRDLQGQNRDDELERAISRFLLDLGFVPGGGIEAKGKWLDLNDLQNRAREYESRFSTLGYYECVFPADKLQLYYEIEDEIPRMREKLVEIDARLGEIRDKTESKRIELQGLEAKISEIQREMDAYESKKGIFSYINRKALSDAKSRLDRARRKLSELKEDDFNLEIRTNDLEETRRMVEQDIEKLKAIKNRTLREITSPFNTRSYHQIELTEDEVKQLKKDREDLKNLSFLEIMRKLGREEEYFRWTHAPINQGDIIFNPMVNYRPSVENASTAKYFETLNRYGFLALDAQGNVINEEEKFGHFVAVLSSRMDNFDDARLGDTAFRSMVTERFAKDADILKLNTPARLHSFAIYTLMIGLQPWQPAPDLPPRLRELEWLGKAYDTSDLSKLQRHHSLFYGTPKPFSVITGIDYKPGEDDLNRENVTAFWKDYEIIEERAIWTTVPILLASALDSFDRLISSIEMAEAIKDMRIPESFSIANITMLVQDLENASLKIDKLQEGLEEGYKTYLSIDKNFKDTIEKLKGAKAFEDGDRLLRMLNETYRDVEILIDVIDNLSKSFNDEVQTAIHNVQDFLGRIPSEETTSSVIRHIAQANSEIEKINMGTKDAIRLMKELGSPLAKILLLLKDLRDIMERAE